VVVSVAVLLPGTVSVIAGTYSSVTGIWNVPDPIPVGGSATLKITTTVNEGFGGTVQNTATITSSSVIDTNPGNDSDSGEFEIPQLDLDIQKSASPDFVNTGEEVMYTVTIRNLSTIFDATTIEVEDIMPVGVILDTSSFLVLNISGGAGTVNYSNKD